MCGISVFAAACNRSESRPASSMVAPPALTQAHAPLLDALRSRVRASHTSFHVPGHKGGRGVHNLLLSSFGPQVFQYDLTEIEGLGNLHAAAGPIERAQELAAGLFGAERTWFLVNGCTAGVQAAVAATCRDGDTLVLARNCHMSAVTGMAWAGARPHWVLPATDTRLGVAHGVAPSAVAQAIDVCTRAGQRVGAVLITSPTYFGGCSDVAGIARVCHDRDVPLIVDEAHGAHLGFLPKSSGGGQTALEQGADLVAQSTHKTLGSLTQSAMLHTGRGARERGVDASRVSSALSALQSSSPSYLLMASLDAARCQLAEAGPDLFAAALQAAAEARAGLRDLGAEVLDVASAGPGSHCVGWDHLRLTVTPPGTFHASGATVATLLDDRFGLVPEMTAVRSVVFALGPGTDRGDGRRLVDAYATLLEAEDVIDGGSGPMTGHVEGLSDPNDAVVLSPREARGWPTECVSIDAAEGRVSASVVCPYPPGIPALVPGERVSPESVRLLERVQAGGGVITGLASGPGLSLNVLKGI